MSMVSKAKATAGQERRYGPTLRRKPAGHTAAQASRKHAASADVPPADLAHLTLMQLAHLVALPLSMITEQVRQTELAGEDGTVNLQTYAGWVYTRLLDMEGPQRHA